MEQVRHKDARPTMDLVPILGKMEWVEAVLLFDYINMKWN